MRQARRVRTAVRIAHAPLTSARRRGADACRARGDPDPTITLAGDRSRNCAQSERRHVARDRVAGRRTSGIVPRVQVSVDRERCIRCAACSTLAPATFAVEPAGARVLAQPASDGERVVARAAAINCPARAIAVTDGEC
jgi:ferredoxin